LRRCKTFNSEKKDNDDYKTEVDRKERVTVLEV